ncbi:MAG TPA: NUDIX domain-containing protein [Chloroflexia bacterium]|nr:NUDIX domain-containing protein [Chloroflexia bacterium]
MRIREILSYQSPEEAQQAGEHIEVVITVPFLEEKFVLCRNRWRAWEFPGGGVEWRESIVEAAERELVEETGAEVSSLEFVSVLWLERGLYRSFKAALFYAEVTELKDHFDYYEVQEVRIFDSLPENRKMSYECEAEIFRLAHAARLKAAS